MRVYVSLKVWRFRDDEFARYLDVYEDVLPMEWKSTMRLQNGEERKRGEGREGGYHIRTTFSARNTVAWPNILVCARFVDALCRRAD